MTDENLEILRGSGNVYRDLGKDDADIRQQLAFVHLLILHRDFADLERHMGAPERLLDVLNPG